MPERTSSRTPLAELAGTLLKVLKKIADDDTSADNVHKLRTTVRRLEVWISIEHPRATKRLGVQLKVLRRLAGRARDADVQLEMLKTLKGLGARQAVDEVSGWLRRRRNKYATRLAAAVQKSSNGSGLQKRLERLEESAEEMVAHTQQECSEAVGDVRREYLSMSTTIPQGGDALHDFRKNCKQLRYTLEPIPDACARRLVTRLKHVQDAIGDWHDWEELAMHAEKRLRRRSLSLLAVLHSRARSARIEARRVVAELREELMISPATRKPVASAAFSASKSPALKSVAR